jgi:hypothetical protein
MKHTYVLGHFPVATLAGSQAAFAERPLDVDKGRVHGQIVPDRVLKGQRTDPSFGGRAEGTIVEKCLGPKRAVDRQTFE